MASPAPSTPLRLFLLFAEEDRELKDELLKHLAVFHALGRVQTWSTESIRPGDDWRESADAAIQEVDAALVLLSADFLAGELARDARAGELMELLRGAGRPIIPVLLRTCLWRHHPWLASLEALPRSGEAISASEGDARDRVFAEVVSAILERLSGRRPDDPANAARPPAAPRRAARPSKRTLLLGGAGMGLALAASLVGLRFLEEAEPRPSPIRAEARAGCPAGRQMYEGACVADKVVDLLVCLKQSGVAGAVSRAEDAVRAHALSATGQADSALSGEISHQLAELSLDERRMILQLCKDAADAAGVKVLAPRPEPTPTLSTKTPAPPVPSVPRTSQPAPTPCKKAGEPCNSHAECCVGHFCKAAVQRSGPDAGQGQGQAPLPEETMVCTPK